MGCVRWRSVDWIRGRRWLLVGDPVGFRVRGRKAAGWKRTSCGACACVRIVPCRWLLPFGIRFLLLRE